MDDFDDVKYSLPPPAGQPFLSRTHRQALTELVRGTLAGEPFIALTGVPGVGKTTVLNSALTVLDERNLRIRRIRNPQGVPLRLPQIIGELLGKSEDGVTDQDVEQLFDTLTSSDTAERLILVFDDAHYLQADVLGYFQIVSSLQALGIKHQQVIFSARPEFWKLLEDPKLRDLLERIKLRPVIEPLEESEARDFLCYRLEQMYGPVRRHVPEAAFSRLIQCGAGIPGRLDSILTNSLAVAGGYRQLRVETVDAAAGAEAGIAPSVKVPPAPDGPGRHSDEPRPPAASIPRASELRHAVLYPGALVCLAALLVGGIGTVTWHPSVLFGPRETSGPEALATLSRQIQYDAEASASAARPASPVTVATTETIEPTDGVPRLPGESPSAAAARTQPTPATPRENSPGVSAPRSFDLATTHTPTAPSGRIVPLPPEMVAELVRIAATHEFRRVSLPLEMVAELVRRGDKMLAIGDISSARLLYTQAAESGDATATMQLGETYDPSFLAQIGAAALPPDPATAAEWYRRAVALGNAAATVMLKRLGDAGR